MAVNVSSNDKAINAMSGSISFPTDKLQVVSVSKSSLVNLWVKEPTFSNSSGRVDFEGIILNPGFKGSSRILSITFKAKVVGTAKVSFASANVLANDGLGTRILSGTGSGSYVISAQKAPEPVLTPTPKPVEKPKPMAALAPSQAASAVPTPTQDPVAPATMAAVEAPEIFSMSHPDQEAWYSDRSVRLVFKISPQADKLRIVLDQVADTVPNIEYPAAIRQKYDLSQDGAWYVHLAQGQNGMWSQTAHFKIQIDSKPPDSLEIKDLDQGEVLEPSFNVQSYDAVSGIAIYNYWVDDGPMQIWRDDGNHVLRLGKQSSGSHKFRVKSIDKAGNSLVKTIGFEIFMSKAEYSILLKGLVIGMVVLLAALAALVIWIIKIKLRNRSRAGHKRRK